MKAILVVDIPDDTEFDNNYRLTGLLLATKPTEKISIEFDNAILKPMPERKETGLGIDIGYNHCIDEILGETE